MTTVIAPPSTATTTLSISKGPSNNRSTSPLRYGSGPQPRSFPTPTMTSGNSANNTPSGSAAATPVIPAASKQQTSRSSPRTNASPETAARSPPSGKPSPNSSSSRIAPSIRVKKEPSSPNMPSSRPRPRRLDLSSSGSALRGPQTAGANPMASKESSGLAIKDLGVACLSPGFQTQDPTLREQLQRSLSVRDQQRQLIEARQKGGSTKAITSQDNAATDGAPHPGGESGLPSGRKKGPPPGLSIHAPSAAAFAHERVIQSAPLHQSFTGLRSHNAHPPPARNMPPSQVHHMHAAQTSNRLPPISDVFAAERMDAPPSASFRAAVPPPLPSPSHGPPMHSPGFPPSQHHHHQHADHQSSQQPSTSRSREFRSAEEAVQGMAAGREELLPKIVHYGGAQPPTPPSPGGHHHPQHREYAGNHSVPHHSSHPPHTAHPAHGGHYESRPELARTSSMSGRRRTREEYERDHGSPNLHPGEFKRYTRDRDEEDWRNGLGSREKKEEFLRLCERAWDLFHS